MTDTPPARILVLVSSPLDASIRLGDDLARLREAAADLPRAAQFDVHVAEPEGVGDLLSRGDRPPYDVLHYLGHGDLLQDGIGVLWFEDQAGAARAMRDANLVTTLQPLGRPEFKLAVISACHSESVAPAVRALGVQHIVAVEADQSVYEIAAVSFYRRFYRALLTGASVEEAFTAGRNAVFNDARLGAQAAGEAAKFKLLPVGAPHDQRPFAGLPNGAAAFDDLPALTAYPFAQQPVEYVGRGEDMRELIAQLNARRAASVLGPSGIGKTELAKQVARWLVARRRVRPEQVGFAALVNAKTAGEVRIEIAKALGLKPDEVGDDGALARLCPPGALLIVDEAEGVIQHDGLTFRNLLNALIDAPARPRVIVTSQTDPNTPKAPPLPVRRLPDDAAFWLFAHNAGLAPEQLGRIAQADLLEVLRFVDRLPRAIELVAQVWQRERGSDPDNLDLRPLLEKLRRDYDQVMADPDYPAEVKSVTVGIQLAYDRLRAESDGAVRLYAYLGLFPGGVSKAGLDALFGPEANDWANAIQRQSLVEMPFSYFPAPLSDLLYLPAPFAAFARRHLPGGDEAAARDAIGRPALRWYYEAWVDVLDASIREGGEAMGAFIARYDAERPSIEAWMDWGYANEACGDGLSRAARLTARLENLYVVTNALHEPQTKARLEQALDSARRCKDAAGEANVRKALGDLLRREDDLKGAREQYDAALKIYPQVGDRLGEANVRKALGDLLMREADLKGAREQYDAALKIYPQVGDRLGEANVRQALGDLLMREADLKGAREQYDAALKIYPQVGDRLGEANVRKALGDLLRREADLKGAREQYDAALKIYPQVGDRLGEANVRKALGNLALAEGRIEEAIRLYGEAASIAQEINDRLGLAGSLGYLARTYLVAEIPTQAVLYGEAALDLFREIGDRFGQSIVLNDQGNALWALDLQMPALGAWWQARELAARVNPTQAQRLQAWFAQIEQQLGAAQFAELAAQLSQEAEGMRLAGVQTVQARVARDAALAQAYERLEAKRYEEARAAYQQIVDALPDDAGALNGLGSALEALRRYDEALDAYGRAVAAQPEVAMLRRNRAHLLLRLGRADEAEADVAAAVRLEPDHPFTRARQGELALARGQFAEARAHFEAAVAAQPEEDAGWLALLALASLGDGEAASAQAAFAALAPKLDDGDREDALLWLERMVALQPALAEAAEAIRASLRAGG